MADAPDQSVRFLQLVAESGIPEVVTLWADPRKDRAFMKLIKGKRVATIVQKPTGTKKDFGAVGFHPQPFAMFLVFPKILKSADGTKIIGIKYDVLQTANPRKSFQPTLVPRPVPKPESLPSKPVEKIFRGRIIRRLSQELAFEVKARNSGEARTKALQTVSEQEIPAHTKKAGDKIVEIREMD